MNQFRPRSLQWRDSLSGKVLYNASVQLRFFRILSSLVLLLFLLLACSSPQNDKPVVVTSFYPLFYFTSAIAGDTMNVISLVPPGVEPHDWEPTPQDVVAVQNSKLFIINGAGFEGWADKLIDAAGNDDRVVVTASGIDLLSKRTATTDEKKGIEQENKEGAVDPHIWLDPANSQQIVLNIANALAIVQPINRELYLNNVNSLVQELTTLDNDFKQGLANCKKHELFTSHAAFGYLAERYGLIQVSLAGLSPDAEPTPSRMADLIWLGKSHNATHIFFETLASPKLAEALAREIGAIPLVLNPIEGLTQDEQLQGKNYISIMRENLHNIRIALDCT